MIYYCESGKRIDAIQVYNRFEKFLLDELGIEPENSLKNLYRLIRKDNKKTTHNS